MASFRAPGRTSTVSGEEACAEDLGRLRIDNLARYPRDIQVNVVAPVSEWKLMGYQLLLKLVVQENRKMPLTLKRDEAAARTSLRSDASYCLPETGEFGLEGEANSNRWSGPDGDSGPATTIC